MGIVSWVHSMPLLDDRISDTKLSSLMTFYVLILIVCMVCHYVRGSMGTLTQSYAVSDFTASENCRYL
jgi:hypothetical protein